MLRLPVVSLRKGDKEEPDLRSGSGVRSEHNARCTVSTQVERALTGRDLRRSAIPRYMIWFDDARLFTTEASMGLTEPGRRPNIKAFINSPTARSPRITSALVSNISMDLSPPTPSKSGYMQFPDPEERVVRFRSLLFAKETDFCFRCSPPCLTQLTGYQPLIRS